MAQARVRHPAIGRPGLTERPPGATQGPRPVVASVRLKREVLVAKIEQLGLVHGSSFPHGANPGERRKRGPSLADGLPTYMLSCLSSPLDSHEIMRGGGRGGPASRLGPAGSRLAYGAVHGDRASGAAPRLRIVSKALST